ncbi:10213_t:CDS:10, partial [Entrophospora sp. SA101]
MSLYGDLPPPTHTSEKEETTEQQSTLETTLQNDKTTTKPSKKPALPAGWTPRFVPIIQRKPVIQAKPKLRKLGKGTKKQLPPPLSLDDDYDPTRPNDYEEYKEMEKKSKENETVHHRQDNFKKRQRSISPSSDHRRRSSPYSYPPPSKPLYSSPSPPQSSSSKNKAFLRRAKLSNSAAVVNESASKSPEIKPTNTSGSGEHFAHRLLAKYGWQEGQGLGKNEQGINVPLMVKKTDVRMTNAIFMNLQVTRYFFPLQFWPHKTSAKKVNHSYPPPSKPLYSSPSPPQSSSSKNKAFLRRAKLSNSAAVVNESASKSPEIKPTNTSGSGEHFAHRLLAKYGWQEGQGLGKNEQGINVPLMVKKTDVRSGIIINNSSNINNPVQVGNELIQKAIQNIETPSRVILLRNMVGPGQVDDTLQEETADECNEKYGTVERCLIFEVPNGKLPDNQAVRIFVKFVDIEAAIKAKKDLNGRFFGGRSVSAKYFDEARFDKLDLAPTPAELDN